MTRLVTIIRLLLDTMGVSNTIWQIIPKADFLIELIQNLEVSPWRQLIRNVFYDSEIPLTS